MTILFWPPEAACSGLEERTRWSPARFPNRGCAWISCCAIVAAGLVRVRNRTYARTAPLKGLREAGAWFKHLPDMRRVAGREHLAPFLPFAARFGGTCPGSWDGLHRAPQMKCAARCSTAARAARKSALALKLIWWTQGSCDAAVFQFCGQRTVTEIAVELANKLKLGVETGPPKSKPDWRRMSGGSWKK